MEAVCMATTGEARLYPATATLGHVNELIIHTNTHTHTHKHTHTTNPPPHTHTHTHTHKKTHMPCSSSHLTSPLIVPASTKSLPNVSTILLQVGLGLGLRLLQVASNSLSSP